MSHNIFFVKSALSNVVNISQYSQTILEPAFLTARQIDLRDVARDDHLAVEAESGEEHLHLLLGGVLSLVENDEAVVKRSSAHIRERSNLDIALLDVLVVRLHSEHIEKRVVKRTQVGVDLALKVSGEKAELFARLNRGSGEDDPVDLLASERRNRHRDREVGFARSRGAYAEGYGVFGYRLAVFLLTDCFGLDGLALRGNADAVVRESVQILRAALLDHGDAVAHVLFA